MFLFVKLKLEPLSYKQMDFEEFCAAAISPYQLEALENWEQIASAAFNYFEQEGNRSISVQELAQVGEGCTSSACILIHLAIFDVISVFAGNEFGSFGLHFSQGFHQTI